MAVLMARFGRGNDLGHGSQKTIEPGLGRACQGENAAARQVLGATQAELGQGAKVGRARYRSAKVATTAAETGRWLKSKVFPAAHPAPATERPLP